MDRYGTLALTCLLLAATGSLLIQTTSAAAEVAGDLQATEKNVLRTLKGWCGNRYCGRKSLLTYHYRNWGKKSSDSDSDSDSDDDKKYKYDSTYKKTKKPYRYSSYSSYYKPYRYASKPRYGSKYYPGKYPHEYHG